MPFSTVEAWQKWAWPEGFVGSLILWVPATEGVEPPAFFCSHLGQALVPSALFCAHIFQKKKKMCLQTKLSSEQTNSDLGSMWPSEIPGGPLSLLSYP